MLEICDGHEDDFKGLELGYHNCPEWNLELHLKEITKVASSLWNLMYEMSILTPNIAFAEGAFTVVVACRE